MKKYNKENAYYKRRNLLIRQQICLIPSFFTTYKNGGESPRRFDGPGTLRFSPIMQQPLHYIVCLLYRIIHKMSTTPFVIGYFITLTLITPSIALISLSTVAETSVSQSMIAYAISPRFLSSKEAMLTPSFETVSVIVEIIFG